MIGAAAERGAEVVSAVTGSEGQGVGTPLGSVPGG